MDTTISALRREAAAGDPAAEARLLVARLRAAPVCGACGGRRLVTPPTSGPRAGDPRYTEGCPACAGTGSPFRARLELAAYCGHAPATAARGGAWTPEWQASVDGLALPVWLPGLSRWGAETLQRAALAAARACEAPWRARVIDPDGAYAGEGWPSQPEQIAEALDEAERALPLADRVPTGHLVARESLPDFAYFAAVAVLGDQSGGHPERRAVRAILGNGHANRTAALEVAGEAPARAAICSTLVAWALA